MVTTIADQLTIKNIAETLETLVESIQIAYEQMDYPTPTEYDIRQLIASVNEQGIQDGKLIESLK